MKKEKRVDQILNSHRKFLTHSNCRNIKIAKEVDKTNMAAVAREYNLSPTRIMQIYDKYKRLEHAITSPIMSEVWSMNRSPLT